MRAFLICLTFFFASLFVGPSAFAQDVDADVQSNLSAIYTSTTDMAEISVTVENGVATLTGDILSAELAKKAVEIAQNRDGIVYVQDQLDRALVGEIGSSLSW